MKNFRIRLYTVRVYIQCNNIVRTICLDVFLIQFISEGKYDEYFLKMYFSVRLGIKKYGIMKWETRCYTPPPSFHSLIYCPGLTYICIISHHCNATESNFNENFGILDILIHLVFKLSKFTPSCICNKCWGVGQYGAMTMMISSATIWLVRYFWMIEMSELWILLGILKKGIKK